MDIWIIVICVAVSVILSALKAKRQQANADQQHRSASEHKQKEDQWLKSTDAPVKEPAIEDGVDKKIVDMHSVSFSKAEVRRNIMVEEEGEGRMSVPNLSDIDEAKRAIIASEILNRKY